MRIAVGTTDDTPVDFPVMTRRVTDLVTRGDADRGILVCGSGVGAAIAANNVACLGAWVVGVRIAEDVISAYLNARFHDDPDVRRRVGQLHEMEHETERDSASR